MTPLQRLRSVLSRLVGERVMLKAAVAILPPGYSVCSDGYVDSVEAFSARSSQERWKADRKRRRLVTRLWRRRADSLRLAAAAKATIDQALAAPEPKWVTLPGIVSIGPLGASVGLGEPVYRLADGRWFPANRERVVQPGGHYAPSGAADLGYVAPSKEIAT